MYTSKQFKNCVFNPLSEGKMLSLYPKLSEIIEPEWTEDENLDRLIRYVICVYDPGSPLVSAERDMNYRKGIAADLAGFDSVMGDDDLMQSIYRCTHDYITVLIVEYLRRFAKSMEFAALIVTESCYWEAVGHLMTPIKGEDSKKILEAAQKKSVLKDEMDKDIARIDKYKKTFFGGDDALEEVFKRKSFSSPEKLLKSTK